MPGTAYARPRGTRHLARLLAGVVFATALISAPQAAEPAPAAAQAGACPALPAGFSPPGSGPTRFTMLVRINQQANVDTYSNFDPATGGLGGRIRPQDIFVINTRFKNTTPAVAATLATNLRDAFPCNRIVGLNGMSFDPASPGYAFSLADHPAVSSLLIDFEPMDWNGGAPTDPRRARWNQKYGVALKRMKVFTGRISGGLSSSPAGAAKRTGLVPIDDASWNYGQIAQVVDKRNNRLGRKRGPQSVQTQDHCADHGPKGFAARAKALRGQYKFKTVKKVVKRRGKDGKLEKRKIKVKRKIKKKGRPLLNNLSVQISFSDTPNPNAGMAITKTAPSTAAACAAAGLKQGMGAFFFFASDASMRLLFEQPKIAFLRPWLAKKPR